MGTFWRSLRYTLGVPGKNPGFTPSRFFPCPSALAQTPPSSL